MARLLVQVSNADIGEMLTDKLKAYGHEAVCVVGAAATKQQLDNAIPERPFDVAIAEISHKSETSGFGSRAREPLGNYITVGDKIIPLGYMSRHPDCVKAVVMDRGLLNVPFVALPFKSDEFSTFLGQLLDVASRPNPAASLQRATLKLRP